MFLKCDKNIINKSAMENSLNLLILRVVYGFLFIKSSLKILLEHINSKGYLWRYLSNQFVKDNILKPLFFKLISIFFSESLSKLISSRMKPKLLLLCKAN